MLRRILPGILVSVVLAACATAVVLQVTDLSPADGATDVAIGTAITATFNVAIDPATVTGGFTLASTGGAVTGTVAYDEASRTATFTPDADLAYATEYTATLAASIATAGGTTLGSDSTWSFTTAAQPDAIGGVDVTPATASLLVGDDVQLTATATGVVGSPDLGVTWSSDDDTIATVSATGLVTAVAPGTTDITATSDFDPTVSGSATITVTEPTIGGIDVAPTTDTLAIGGTSQLTATPTGVVGSPDLGVTWSSDDDTIATVSATGLVTAVAPGTTDITATSDFDPTVSGSATITVVAPMTGDLSNYVLDIFAGETIDPPLAPTFSGGAAPFTFALLPLDPLAPDPINGLPPGVTLDPTTGLISGTPTTANYYRAAIEVTDAVGQTLEIWSEIDVFLVLEYAQTVYTYDPTAVGVVVPSADVTVVGENGPLVFSMVLDDSGPTPGAESDWSINPATGAISRVTNPTVGTSTWTYTITVDDPEGSKDASFTITLNEIVP